MSTLLLPQRFYQEPIVFAVHAIGSERWGAGYMREAILIRLLALCAQGWAFESHSHLSKISQYPENQCKLVWSACIDNGIIRENNGKYSAAEWLIENGFLNDVDNTPKTRPKRVQNPRASNSSTEPKIAQTGGKESQQSASNAERAFYTDKIAVRPNVFLSHAEIAELKKTYSKEEITKMVDYFSDWKFKKGSNVRTSDYQCIVRWVYKILKEEQQQPTEQTKDSNPFPDWVYGAKQ